MRMFKHLSQWITGGGKDDAVRHQGLYLPRFRTNQDLSNNDRYVQSAVEQVQQLRDHCGLHDQSRLLDFGCGQGRLAIGLQHLGYPFKSYVGVDTDARSVSWCRKWLSDDEGRFTFIHLAAHNARYNPQAASLQPLPFPAASFDLAFLNSVFSHMIPEDVRFYLAELHRVLDDDGVIYLTAFIEENVPDHEENPDNYLGKSRGPLHRVRYARSFFDQMIQEAGLATRMFLHHGVARTGQSIVIVSRKPVSAHGAPN